MPEDDKKVCPQCEGWDDECEGKSLSYCPKTRVYHNDYQDPGLTEGYNSAEFWEAETPRPA